jgi:hypothetical protein
MAGRTHPRACGKTKPRGDHRRPSSGRVWSTSRFMPWGSNDAAAAPSTAWLAARRIGSPAPREASQPTPLRAQSTFSSAPQVRARASLSGAGPILRATVRAMATPASVVRMVTEAPLAKRLPDRSKFCCQRHESKGFRNGGLLPKRQAPGFINPSQWNASGRRRRVKKVGLTRPADRITQVRLEPQRLRLLIRRRVSGL